MALIRASEHEEAIRLLEESRPKKPDATRVIVNSLALLPSNPDKAIELIQETKKRKHGPFDESLDDILLLWEFERLAK
jgi:hypothetical protein